jgi:hypothetical protein
MFNLYRIKKKHIDNYFFNKRNYLPKNLKFSFKVNSLCNPYLIRWKGDFNNYVIKKENPEMIVIFYMILGITVGSFIYYIKL